MRYQSDNSMRHMSQSPGSSSWSQWAFLQTFRDQLQQASLEEGLRCKAPDSGYFPDHGTSSQAFACLTSIAFLLDTLAYVVAEKERHHHGRGTLRAMLI